MRRTVGELFRQATGIQLDALAAGIVAGLVLGVVSRDDPWIAGLTLLLAAALAVRVAVPWGGHVPLGFALAAALPALPARALLVLPVAVGLAATAVRLRSGRRQGALALLRLGPPCGAALAVVLVLDLALPGLPVLVRALAAAVALVGTDLTVTRVIPPPARPPLLESLPVYLTLACGAALVAVATAGFGVSMALVAVFPLLITRFSFQRYAAARDTLDQTVQALGLVPELAGLVPLGHSERAAVYAGALADVLGLGRGARQRVLTATRLHHLGAVPFDPADPSQRAQEPPDVRSIAASGAHILREAGFPADVATLVERAVADGGTPVPSLEAAVVCVSGRFDDVVGEDPLATSRGLAVLSATTSGSHERRAVAALLEATALHPDLVPGAVAAGARFREAALDVDLDHLVGVGGLGSGTIIPFARRRGA